MDVIRRQDVGPASAFVQESVTDESIRAEWQALDKAQDGVDWGRGRLIRTWLVHLGYGRTQADLADMLGVSPSYVSIHLAAWDKFADFYQEFPSLSHTHFREALHWDDWIGPIRWAASTGASSVEMRNYWQQMQAAKQDGQESTDPDPPKKRGRKRKTAQPVIYEEKPPLAVVTEMVQIGSCVTPEEPTFAVNDVILGIRSILKPVSQDADAEERQEVYEELLAWLARICPEKPIPRQTEIHELVTAPTVVNDWNKLERVKFVDSLTPKRKGRLQSLLEDEVWRSTYRVALQKLEKLTQKWPEWRPEIHWFMLPNTVKKLLRGDFDAQESPPTDKRAFTPPTVADVQEYCDSRRAEGNRINAQEFVDYYNSQGWQKSNGRDLTDWRAAIRTWEKRDQRQSPPSFRRGTGSSVDDVMERGRQSFGDGDQSPWGRLMSGGE